MRVLLPPEITTIHVLEDGKEITFERSNEYVSFTLTTSKERKHEFVIQE